MRCEVDLATDLLTANYARGPDYDRARAAASRADTVRRPYFAVLAGVSDFSQCTFKALQAVP